MTQFEATCTNCGGRVLHLLPAATVERCDACKGLEQKLPLSKAAPPMKGNS